MGVLDYFPQALQALRSVRGLTQAELGRRAGIGKGQIGRYERGEATPDFKGFERLARALGTTTPDFMRLAQALQVIAEAGAEGERQLDLFPGHPSQVAETDTVVKVLYLTDSGILVQVDDPAFNHSLTETLATTSPERKVILSLQQKLDPPRSQ